MPEFTGHRDIRSYIRAIWRWKLLILVLVVGAPAVAYLMEHGKPKQYLASTTVSLIQNGTVSTAGTVFQENNVQAVAELITTSPVASIAATQLQPPESGSEVVSGVSASGDPLTNYITITAVKNNPVEAANVANAFATALNVDGSKQTKANLRQQIHTIKAQLTTVSKTSANYGNLQANLQTYEQQLIEPNHVATTIQPAKPNDTPVGPHTRRAVELGLVIGILLAAAAVMLLDSADRRLRSPDELEELTKLPVLAAIPPSAFDNELETGPADAEAFQTLRTSLTYFTVVTKLRSVLITSPGEQEGKSTVAVRLALAAAHAGLDVVLVDADMRRAGATEKLGVNTQVGLGLALAEQRPVGSVLITWPLGPDAAGRLRVLPAGPPPPNPAALISSEAMRSLVKTLEDQADLVIIDSPAALAVSDAVPLMQSVSGVVLIARMNRSSRETVNRLQKITLSAHAHLLGTVATGVTTGPGYERYSQAYYTSTGGRKSRGHRRKRDVDAATAATNGGPSSADRRSADGVAPLEIVPQARIGRADDNG